jgi:hypothetical protein
VRWHRAGFRRYWRWKSRSRGGRPQIDLELRITYADRADEYGEFALGRAAHPRRTSLALRCDRNEPLATSPINPADVFTFKWISNADMPSFKLARWRGPVANRNTTGTVRPFKGLDARRRTIAARH